MRLLLVLFLSFPISNLRADSEEVCPSRAWLDSFFEILDGIGSPKSVTREDLIERMRESHITQPRYPLEIVLGLTAEYRDQKLIDEFHSSRGSRNVRLLLAAGEMREDVATQKVLLVARNQMLHYVNDSELRFPLLHYVGYDNLSFLAERGALTSQMKYRIHREAHRKLLDGDCSAIQGLYFQYFDPQEELHDYPLLLDQVKTKFDRAEPHEKLSCALQLSKAKGFQFSEAQIADMRSVLLQVHPSQRFDAALKLADLGLYDTRVKEILNEAFLYYSELSGTERIRQAAEVILREEGELSDSMVSKLEEALADSGHTDVPILVTLLKANRLTSETLSDFDFSRVRQDLVSSEDGRELVRVLREQ